MRKSLFAKLLFSHLLVIMVSYFILGFSLSLLFSRYYFSLQEKELMKRGESLVDILTQNPDLRFEVSEVARQLAREGIFINIMSKEDLLRERLLPPRGFMRRMWGKVAETDLPQKIWEKIARREYASWQNFHPVLRQNILSVALPLERRGKIVAALILSLPLTSVETTIKTVEYFLFFSSLISLGLSLFVAFLSSSSLTRPLKKMSTVARQLARGNFQEKIKIETQDEVGQLAQDFNILSEALKETIRKLQEEKDRTENIVLHMSEGVLAIDGEKNIVSMNPTFRKTLTIQEKAISHLRDLHLGEEIEILFEEVLKTGQEQEKEVSLGDKYVIFHITPLKENGTAKGAVAVVQDITELRKVDRLRREFIANVSHELRTPLTSIQGFLEAAIDQVISLEEFKEKYLPLIHSETLRLSRLIHDLLDLSLMESGKIQWKMGGVLVCQVVHRVIAKLSPLSSTRQVVIREELEDNLPPVLGNEDRLEQVFTNLLHNAILFSSPGSSITVSGRIQERNLLFFVRDHGSGIPPQDLPYIFERFYRVEKSRSRESGGTGLGLAITKQIIEHHGGKIWVESVLNQGTTFFFTLPLFPSPLHQSPT
ncbi:MAG: ATP-binding protein [Atribacterota bacterium]